LFLALYQSGVEVTKVWSRAVASGQTPILVLNSLLLIGFGALATVTTVTGIRALGPEPLQRWPLIVSLVPQLVSISVTGFQYRLCMLGFVGVGAIHQPERVRAGFFAESGTQMLVGFETIAGWQLQLNLAALTPLVLALTAWQWLTTPPNSGLQQTPPSRSRDGRS
jgi:hypothetical protein